MNSTSFNKIMDTIDNILNVIVKNGAFGSVKYVRTTLEEDIDKGTQFASFINFVTLTVNDGKKDTDYPLVIKKQHFTEGAKELFNSGVAFRNEVIMYSKLLPIINACKLNLFAQHYDYKDASGNISNEVLIFENLQYEGYKVTEERIFLDCEHIELALRKLGEFHGLSYLAKRQHKERFLSEARGLIETKFTGNNDADHQNTIIKCLLRGITPLIEQNIQVEVLRKVISKLENSIEVAKLLIEPEEPFSILCHGDFCRNNIFYKYINNKPIGIKFFDLQNALYTSPAIDLAFFLYLNTTSELREKQWDNFLKIYWKSFSNSIPNLEFNFDQFLEHFSKRAIYGYFPTCFFLPMLIDEESVKDVEEYTALPAEERLEIMLNYGGNEGTELVVNVVKHLLDRNYLHKFLEL